MRYLEGMAEGVSQIVYRVRDALADGGDIAEGLSVGWSKAGVSV